MSVESHSEVGLRPSRGRSDGEEGVTRAGSPLKGWDSSMCAVMGLMDSLRSDWLVMWSTLEVVE